MEVWTSILSSATGAAVSGLLAFLTLRHNDGHKKGAAADLWPGGVVSIVASISAGALVSILLAPSSTVRAALLGFAVGFGPGSMLYRSRAEAEYTLMKARLEAIEEIMRSLADKGTTRPGQRHGSG